MTTIQSLITDAYIESRVTDSIDGPESSQLTVGLRWLKRIIARLSTNQIYIPYSTSENFSITTSSQSYTMGSGGTASTSRARKILNCYVRDSSNVDTSVRIISETDWNRIPDKSTTGRPFEVFYDPVYPVGVLYFYFKPEATYTAFIESQKDLHTTTLTLGTTLSLPEEYEDALVVSLGAKIARANGAPTEQSLVGDAVSAWSAIGNLNLSQRVPMAVLPFSKPASSKWLFEGYDS